MRRRNRAIGLLVVVVFLVTMVSGCSLVGGRSRSVDPSSAPLSPAAAAALLNAIPGVTDAVVKPYSPETNWYVEIDVHVADASTLAAPGVLEYVLRIGWATNIGHVPDTLTLEASTPTEFLNLKAQANAITGENEDTSADSLSVALSDPTKFLGRWPGAVPPVPSSVPTASPSPGG